MFCISWLNSLCIIFTFCKGQAYDLPDSASLALGCVLCSWQEFQESWSASHVCPSDLPTAKHSEHSGQVLGYHLIRAVHFPFHFVNGCFCCWLQRQLSFLLSRYEKTEQWWQQFGNSGLALKQSSCYLIKKGVVLTTQAYSNLPRPILELKYPFLQFQWRPSQGNKSL